MFGVFASCINRHLFKSVLLYAKIRFRFGAVAKNLMLKVQLSSLSLNKTYLKLNVSLNLSLILKLEVFWIRNRGDPTIFGATGDQNIRTLSAVNNPYFHHGKQNVTNVQLTNIISSYKSHFCKIVTGGVTHFQKMSYKRIFFVSNPFSMKFF